MNVPRSSDAPCNKMASMPPMTAMHACPTVESTGQQNNSRSLRESTSTPITLNAANHASAFIDARTASPTVSISIAIVHPPANRRNKKTALHWAARGPTRCDVNGPSLPPTQTTTPTRCNPIRPGSRRNLHRRRTRTELLPPHPRRAIRRTQFHDRRDESAAIVRFVEFREHLTRAIFARAMGRFGGFRGFGRFRHLTILTIN